MILRLQKLLSDVSYARKNLIFHEENLKLTKNNTFNNVLSYNMAYFISIKLIDRKPTSFIIIKLGKL